MYNFTDQSSAALILTHSNADLHIVDDDGGEVPHDLLPHPPLEVRPGKLVGNLIHHELQYRGLDGVNLNTIFGSEKPGRNAFGIL